MYNLKSFVHKNWKLFFEPTFFSWILWTLATFPLVIVAYIGTFSRYIADDYSTVGMVKTLGFWNSQVYWFQTWTGSFTYTFLTSFLGLLDVYTASWLPFISLLVWFALLFGAFKYSFLTLGLSFSHGWLALITSLAIFTCGFSFADYTQVLLWQTGIVAYLFASMMFTGIVFYYARRFFTHLVVPVSLWELVLIFLAFFLFAGIGETWAIMQIALLFMGFVSLLFVKELNTRRLYSLMFATSLLASVSSFIILFISPGNASRKSDFFAFSFDWVMKSLWLSAADVFVFLSEWIVERTMLVAALLVIGVMAGFFASRNPHFSTPKQNGILIYIVLVCFVMLWAGLFPGFFIFRDRPPDRAIFPAMASFIFGAILVSVSIGQRLSQVASRFSGDTLSWLRVALYAWMLIFLILSPLRTATGLMNTIPVYRHYAQLWDERDAYLRQARMEGQGDEVVFSFKGHPDFRDIRKTIWVRGDMEDNPRYWINEAASDYYGLNSIIAVNEK